MTILSSLWHRKWLATAITIVLVALLTTSAVERAAAAPTFTFTKTDALTTDADGDTVPSPGDTLTYTITVDVATDPATNASFSDTIDSNTTLVGGSVSVTPIARDDVFSGMVGNIPYTVQGLTGNVLNNDNDPDGGAISIVGGPFPIAIPTTQGGSVALNADGTFEYDPPVGLSTGTDSWTYQVVDDESDTDTATVTISFSGEIVWFVDSSAVGSTDVGTFSNPFEDLNDLNGVSADVDDPGDTIFVYQGSGTYTQSITLENNQTLLGETAGLTINATQIVTPGSDPSIGASGISIGLAQNNVLQGFTVTNGSSGMFGSNVGTLQMTDVDFVNTGTGPVINGATNITGVGGGQATIGTISTIGGEVIGLSNIAAGDITIGSATGGQVDIQSSTVDVSFTTLNIGTSGSPYMFGDGVSLSSVTGTIALGTANIYTSDANNEAIFVTSGTNTTVTSTGGTLSAVNETVVDITGANLNMVLNSVSSTGSGNDGLRLVNTTGTQFSVIGTAANATNADGVGGTITNTTGDGVVLTNITHTFSLEDMIIGNAAATDIEFPTDTSSIGGEGIQVNGSSTGLNLRNVHVTRTASDGLDGFGVNNMQIIDSLFSNNGSGDNDHAMDFGHFSEANLNNERLTGTVLIQNTIFTGFTEEGFQLENINSGTLNLTFDNATFRNNDTGTACGGLDCEGSGIEIRGDAQSGAATLSMTVTIQNSTFSRIAQDGIDIGLENDDLAGATGGTAYIDIINNELLNSPNGSQGIIVANGSTSTTFDFEIRDNVVDNFFGPLIVASVGDADGNTDGVIDNNTLLNSDGDAMRVIYDSDVSLGGVNSGNFDAKVAVTNNTITNFDQSGLVLEVADSASGSAADFVVRGNDIGQPADTQKLDPRTVFIRANNGVDPCVDIQNNFIGRDAVQDFFPPSHIFIQESGSGTDIRLEGLSPNPANTSQTTTFLTGANTYTAALPTTLELFPQNSTFDAETCDDPTVVVNAPIAPAKASVLPAEAPATTQAPQQPFALATAVTAPEPFFAAERTAGAARPAASGETVNVSLGNLDVGQQVTVTFAVTIDSPLATGVTQVCNQASLSGGNFTTLNSDDPDVGGASDATCTAITINPQAALTPSSHDFGSVQISGGSASHTFTLTNTQPPSDAALNITAVGFGTGTSYSITGGTCPTSFPASLAAGASCTIEVTCDPAAVGTYNDTLEVTSNAGGTPGTVSSSSLTCVGSNAAVTVTPGGDVTVDEAAPGDTATYDVVLVAEPATNVVIDVSTDGQCTITNPALGTAGELTFTNANWDTPQTVTVVAVDDDIDEINVHTCTITHTIDDAQSDAIYDGISVDSAFFNVLDDDVTGITVIPGADTTVAEADTLTDTATYDVVLDTEPVGIVVIDVTTDGQCTVTSPFAGTSGELTFTNANWDTPQTVTLVAVDDNIDESDPHICVVDQLVDVVNTTDPLYIVNVDDPNISVADDDTNGASGVGSGDTTVAEANPLNLASYSLILDAKPATDVVIDIATDGQCTVTNPFDGTSGSVTFTPANWDTPQALTVIGVNDSLAEPNPHDCVISHSVDTALSDDAFDSIVIAPFIINVIDDDQPPVPQSLTAVYDSVTHQVTLQWADLADNEDGYLIERQKDGATSWVTINTLAPNTILTLDETIVCDQTYRYRVTAFNLSGEASAVSSLVNTTCDIFVDVPTDLPAPFMEPWVETFYQAGITGGKVQCDDGTTAGPGELLYCPSDEVTRGEMAVFILRAMEYPNLPYDPPDDLSDPFVDVFTGSPDLPAPFMEDWIEEFFARNITGGKGTCEETTPSPGLTFCPKDKVTRGEMAVFILKALGITPVDDLSDPFVDVPGDLPAPFMEAYVETFLAEGITGGKPNCVNTTPVGSPTYCPQDNVTRAEMAVFILRAFDQIPDPNDP